MSAAYGGRGERAGHGNFDGRAGHGEHGNSGGRAGHGDHGNSGGRAGHGAQQVDAALHHAVHGGGKFSHEWQDQPKKPLLYMYGSGVLLSLAAFAASGAAAYGLTTLLYRRTGAPPELWRNVITCVLGLILLSGCVTLFTQTVGRKHVISHEHPYEALRNALSQIARGNFDVALDPSLDRRLAELTNAVSDMARSLGTLETMRQDFVSNVSHEIQSPLTSIGGFAALLQNRDLPAEERVRYAKIIETESKRLSSLSDNLLKLSTLDGGKLPLARQDFRLDKQLERVTLTLEPQWSAKNLTVEADLEKCTVNGDEDLLSQVWTNLLYNAVKFTPEGGRIDVSLTVSGGDTAAVTVADTGIGIAPDDQIHIFERFYKVDKARDRSLGGNGLGLSLVKRIVELHGGRVSVESEAGKGSAFQVFLPLEPAP